MTTRTLTRAELVVEMTERFGADPLDWAFACPHCREVATARDFHAAEADPNRVRAAHAESAEARA
ncbi:MAG: hypothetical protein J2P20_11175 [Pseudonocardia sp.]|nr:hypothetical protein [Pseudonocardia sp.]